MIEAGIQEGDQERMARRAATAATAWKYEIKKQLTGIESAEMIAPLLNPESWDAIMWGHMLMLECQHPPNYALVMEWSSQKRIGELVAESEDSQQPGDHYI